MSAPAGRERRSAPRAQHDLHAAVSLLRDRERALLATLVARCLERVGDDAVDIGEQVHCLVTAEALEFEDASHPKRHAA